MAHSQISLLLPSVPHAVLGQSLAVCKTDRIIVQQCQPSLNNLPVDWNYPGRLLCAAHVEAEKKKKKRNFAFYHTRQAWVGLPILQKKENTVGFSDQQSLSGLCFSGCHSDSFTHLSRASRSWVSYLSVLVCSFLTCHIQGSTRNDRFVHKIAYNEKDNSLSTDLVKTFFLIFLHWYLMCSQMVPVPYQGKTVQIPQLRQDLPAWVTSLSLLILLPSMCLWLLACWNTALLSVLPLFLGIKHECQANGPEDLNRACIAEKLGGSLVVAFEGSPV